MYTSAFLITTLMINFIEASIDPFDYCPKDYGGKKRIHIAGFYTFSERVDGTGRIPAIELAVDHVNNNTDVLKDYQICVIWRNCKCISSGGIWAFHKHLAEEPTKIALLGPPCSTSTAPVAETAQEANLTTMSYWASSPSLSDRERYPYFFRTFLSETLLNPPKVELLKRFNWTKIGILLHNEEIFTSTQEDLLVRLNNISVTPAVQEVFDKLPNQRQLDRFQDIDLRIFFWFAYEDTARYLFCKVYHDQLYGSGYVWLMPGWYADDWWIKDTQIEGCTNEQIETAVVESLYITSEANIDLTSLDDVAISGLEAREFENSRLKKRDELLRDYPEIPYKYTFAGVEGFAYDAVWAIALSLNRTAAKYPIENFTYEDVEMGRRIFDDMTETNFIGVTGSVAFNAGDREGSSSVEQLQALPCDEGWEYARFYCYKFVTDKSAWGDARRLCQNSSAFLASILSEEEINSLIDLSKNETSEEWFIGLAPVGENNLTWVDTTNQRYPLWFPEDFNQRNERGPCYTFNSHSGEWSSEKCDTPKPFICKGRPTFRERIIFTYGTDQSLKEIEGRQLIWHDGFPPPDRVVTEVSLTVLQYIFLLVFACIGLAIAIAFLVFNIKARHHRFVKLSSPRLNNLIIAGAILVYLAIALVGLEVQFREGRRTFEVFCMLHVWLIIVGTVLCLGALFSKTWRVYKVANIKGVQKVKIKDSQLFVQVGVILLIGVIILIIWSAVDPLKHEKMYSDESQSRFTQTCTCRHFTVWAAMLIIYLGVILIFGVFLAWHTRKVSIKVLNDSKLIGVCIYNITILFAVTIGMSAVIEDSPTFRYVFFSSILHFCASFTLITIFLPKVIFVYRYPDADRKTCTNSEPSNSRDASAQNDVNQPPARVRWRPNSGNLWSKMGDRLGNLTGFNMESSTTGCERTNESDVQSKSGIRENNDPAASSRI